MLKKNKNLYLSIVLSFRDEQEVLSEYMTRTRKVMTELKNRELVSAWEFIFVDDASSDNSVTILRELDSGYKDIKILSMSRVFGVFECTLAGLERSKGDIVVYMDCDLQDPPEIIPQMIEKYLSNNEIEVVHTKRKSRLGESFIKLFFTKIGYKILNRYSSVPIPEEVGDFKLLSKRIVTYIVSLKEFRPWMRGIVSYVGFKQDYVYYDRQPRFAGKSKFFIFGPKAISNFLNSAFINFSSVPLQLATYCGLATIVIDFVLIIYVLLEKIQGKAVPGWSAVMIVILFFSAAQLLCTGIIGLYINSIHEQSKLRPRFIINYTYGFEDE